MVDQNEAAHNEPPHLDLHCLPSSLFILNMTSSLTKGYLFIYFANVNFVVCAFGAFTRHRLEICCKYYIFNWLLLLFVMLLFYVHGKHLRSCQDGQLT